MRPSNRNISRPHRFFRMVLVLAAVLAVTAGCSNSGDKADTTDITIPENESWSINTVLDVNTADGDVYVDPHVAAVSREGRVHMAYYRANTDAATAAAHPYKIMYRSFPVSEMFHMDESNTVDETVTLLEDDSRNLGMLSISLAGDTPVIAYPMYKQYIVLPNADLNNQGDVMIAVRDGAGSWRNEIGAYGYVSPDRNPVFRDGLAMGDFCVKGDGNGGVMLSFQFYYEGIDSYNYAYPDMRYIRQPVNAFVNASVNDVADIEETIEGNVYQNGASGQQSFQGGRNDVVVDEGGNPVVFYGTDNSVNGSAQDKGLRVGRRIDNGDGTHTWDIEWIEDGINVAAIKGAVKPDGRLAVVYAVKDVADFIDSQVILPFILKYAEQVDTVTGTDADGNDIVVRRWETEYVNYSSICGRFCSMVLDAGGQPVVAYYDELNFTLNRFFSRVKISRREAKNLWTVDVISPEDVGLSNNTSPFEVTAGSDDAVYIGQYNSLWLDTAGRVCLTSYSSVSRKVYLFVKR